MLRITVIPSPLPTIHLEGKLLTPWLEEVSTAIASARDSGSFQVDLAGLSFADHEGAALLRRLRSEGITVVGGSAFIEGLLERHGA